MLWSFLCRLTPFSHILVRNPLASGPLLLVLSLVSDALTVRIQAPSSQEPCVTCTLSYAHLLSHTILDLPEGHLVCVPSVFTGALERLVPEEQTEGTAKCAPGWSVFLSVGKVL